MSSDSEWSAFFESSNDTRILMLCIANTRLIVLQSRSLVHNTTSSGHFGRAIRRPFLRAIKSPIFFKHGSNFGIVSLNVELSKY